MTKMKCLLSILLVAALSVNSYGQWAPVPELDSYDHELAIRHYSTINHIRNSEIYVDVTWDASGGEDIAKVQRFYWCDYDPAPTLLMYFNTQTTTDPNPHYNSISYGTWGSAIPKGHYIETYSRDHVDYDEWALLQIVLYHEYSAVPLVVKGEDSKVVIRAPTVDKVTFGGSIVTDSNYYNRVIVDLKYIFESPQSTGNGLTYVKVKRFELDSGLNELREQYVYIHSDTFMFMYPQKYVQGHLHDSNAFGANAAYAKYVVEFYRNGNVLYDTKNLATIDITNPVPDPY